jgi:hypothetical protein
MSREGLELMSLRRRRWGWGHLLDLVMLDLRHLWQLVQLGNKRPTPIGYTHMVVNEVRLRLALYLWCELAFLCRWGVHGVADVD